MDKVIVGMPGPWATNYSEPADHRTSKIGGLPDWPIPIDAFDPEFLECGVCSCRLALVSQIYAPVYAKGMYIEERTLYVFGCVRTKCGDSCSSWRVIRLQKTPVVSANDASVEKPYSENSVSAPGSSFLEDNEYDYDYDYGYNDDDDLSLEDLSNAFKDLATSNSQSRKANSKKQENIFKTGVTNYPLRLQPQVDLSGVTVLPCFYLYTQEEPSATVNRSLSCDEKQFNRFDHDEENWDKEDYEYDKALNADRTYLKYKKVIDQCPEQCIRYKYGGKPLFASKTSFKPSPCQQCGAPRGYEMQLMPPLVYFLHEGAPNHPKYSLDNWNWMTLIIYTCAKNCSSIRRNDNNICQDWTVAEEEIELQLEERPAIFSPLLAKDPIPCLPRRA